MSKFLKAVTILHFLHHSKFTRRFGESCGGDVMQEAQTCGCGVKELLVIRKIPAPMA